MSISTFIQENILWLTPVVTILTTLLIKLSARPTSFPLRWIEMLDFGFDLAISSIITLSTGTSRDDLGLWLIFFSAVLILLAAQVVSRCGWNKSTRQLAIWGMLIPDIVGIFILFITIQYIVGAVQ